MRLWKLITNLLIVLLIGLIAVEFPWVGLGLLVVFAVGRYMKWAYGKNRKLRKRLSAIEKKLIPLNDISKELREMKTLFADYLQNQALQRRKEEEKSFENYQNPAYGEESIYSEE